MLNSYTFQGTSLWKDNNTELCQKVLCLSASENSDEINDLYIKVHKFDSTVKKRNNVYEKMVDYAD